MASLVPGRVVTRKISSHGLGPSKLVLERSGLVLPEDPYLITGAHSEDLQESKWKREVGAESSVLRLIYLLVDIEKFFESSRL